MTRTDRATRWTSDLHDAASFLTSVIPGRSAPSPQSMTYFPGVGAAIGLAVGGIWIIARRSLGSWPGAVVATVADVGLTGALHLDGVADYADGVFAHVPVKSRLEIMSEPQVGTFAAVALSTTLLARSAAFAALEPSPLLIGSLWGCSRALMVIASRTLPYAREHGLATPFLEAEHERDHAVAVALSTVAATALVLYRTNGRRGVFAMGAGLIAGSGVLQLARRRLGGFTGDVLGAAGVVFETIALVTLAESR